MKMKITIILFFIANMYAQPIQTPTEFYGFEPGSDRNLFKYNKLIEYLTILDKASAKLKLEKIGESPMGKPMYIAFISSQANINNLDQLKNINRQLAINPDLSDSQRQEFINNGRVFVLGTLSMHSGEVGPSQAAPIIAYELITSADPNILDQLDKVVYMMVPNHNPDGMDMIVSHYLKYKGTKNEGSSMPGVYHKYVGHDNNRDFVILSQSDTKAIARIYNLDWFPQVMVEKHQMGSTGPRLYVPPSHDPIAENIDAGIWNWAGLFGANMIKDMTTKKLSGISQHYLFDDYWPGSTETCIWKNVIGFLTEAASARYATPIYVEPNELRVYGKGLSEYKKSTNMPLLWPGGWWHLSDIVEYEKESTYSILKTASKNHDEILTYRNDLCRREVEKGKSEPPYYYIFPKDQLDQSELVSLVHLLQEHGIMVYELSKDVLSEETQYRKGDIIVPLSQSFRPFIKEVLERQKYPVRHYTPNGEIIKPYDITSWSLPLHKGLTVYEINSPTSDFENKIKEIGADYAIKVTPPAQYNAAIFSATNNESFYAAFAALAGDMKVSRLSKDLALKGKSIPAGSFIIDESDELNQLIETLRVSPEYITDKPDAKNEPVKQPKIGLVETYFHDMDAGWTRFIFDSYKIPFKILRPADLVAANLTKNYDVVIFPDVDKSVLMEGKRKSDDNYYVSSYPPEYTKGMTKKGKENLLKFVNEGGLIIAWGRSTGLFTGMQSIEYSKKNIEEFQLPFSDVSDQLKKEGLYCPGSFVQIQLRRNHPLTYGLPDQIGVFYRGRPAFRTSVPNFDMDRRVIANFPEEDILLSGYCENESKLANKTAMTWIKKGKGQLVLFAFNPQFRASTPVSYKLLFNSILLQNK
jgi:hypothetical protein